MTAPMLLGPRGDPIGYRKAPTPQLGPAYGDWAGRDATWNQFPGAGVLQFDLSRLSLADYRAMRYHPQVNASLSLLTFMMHQVEWHVEADDAKVRDRVEETIYDVWTPLVRAFSQSLWSGFSPNVIEWDNDPQGRWVIIDRIKDMAPEECRVHWKEVEGYAPSGQVRPKFKYYDGIVHNSYGDPGVDRIIRRSLGQGVGRDDEPHIPAECTLWYPLMMENGDYYGRKLLKAAFAPWYYSILIHLFANRYYERFGEPIPMGRYPSEADVDVGDGNTMSAKTLMEQVLTGLRNRAVALLPSDRVPTGPNGRSEYEYTLEYLESQMRGADFERYLTRLDEEISLALFTPILLLRTGDVGSHNLGVQHTRTWLWMLNALGADWKDYLDRYVCNRIRDFNFGPNAGRVKWVPRPFGKENVETIRAIITELIRQGSAKVDLQQLGEYLGMDVTAIRQVTEPPPVPGQPQQDPRIGRDVPDRGGRTRGTGEPRATANEINNRVRSQVTKAWREGRFGDGLKLHFGYERRMEHAFVAEGMDELRARAVVQGLYRVMQVAADDLVALGPDEFSGPEDFMSLFGRQLEARIEDALA